jgi:hypothetical protein
MITADSFSLAGKVALVRGQAAISVDRLPKSLLHLVREL